MGAVTTAVLSLMRSGDHVVAQRSHYAGMANLLRDVLPRFGVRRAARFGVTRTEVDQASPAAFEMAMRETTRLVMVETPTNPALPSRSSGSAAGWQGA